MYSDAQDRILSTKSLLIRSLPDQKSLQLRRVGRPIKFWTTENMRKAWEIIQQADNAQPHVPFDPANRTIRETSIVAARNYQAPFD